MFREMGCRATRGKRVLGLRGTRAVDVYVEDFSNAPSATYLCECKHWKRRVTQTTVDAFVNVVAHTGANLGFIVSTNGAQRGAKLATKRSNVRVVTPQELQALFADRWVKNQGVKLQSLSQELTDLTASVGSRISAMSTDAGSARIHLKFRECLALAMRTTATATAVAFILDGQAKLPGIIPDSKTPGTSMVVDTVWGASATAQRALTQAIRQLKLLRARLPRPQ